jgi:hypothetical protein
MPHIVKSLFGRPRCSKHGTIARRVAGALFDRWKCDMCTFEYEQKKKIEELQKEINKLKSSL